MINPSKNTEVTYNVTLTKPGDFYEFTVDVKNYGSIDGMIDRVTSKLNNMEIGTLPAYLDYSVTYSDGVSIVPKHKLDAGDSETYKVRIEFKKDIDVSDLPTTPQNLSLAFSVTYAQKDNTAIEIPHPIIRYVVQHGGWGSFLLNQEVPSGALLRLTPNEALQDWRFGYSSTPLYAKHVIANNVVKESYMVFVVTNELANSYPGMTPGTYELRGYTDSTYFDENVEVVKTAFGYSTNPSRCGIAAYDSSLFTGSVGRDFDVYIYMNGSVSLIRPGSTYCYFFDSSFSICDYSD